MANSIGKDPKNRASFQEMRAEIVKMVRAEIQMHGHGNDYIVSVVTERDRHKKTFKLLAINVIINLVLVGGLILFILLFAGPKYKFFATNENFELRQLKALDSPVLTDTGLVNWTASTVTDTLSLDFIHWRSQLMKQQNKYTDGAWASFIASLKESGTIKWLEKDRLITHVTLRKAGIVTDKLLKGGRTVYKVELPVIISFESSKGLENSENWMAQVQVVRVGFEVNPAGIQISQINMIKE